MTMLWRLDEPVGFMSTTELVSGQHICFSIEMVTVLPSHTDKFTSQQIKLDKTYSFLSSTNEYLADKLATGPADIPIQIFC